MINMQDKTVAQACDPTRYVLAIDLGSGGHKVAVVADTGEVIASAAKVRFEIRAISVRELRVSLLARDEIEETSGMTRAA